MFHTTASFVGHGRASAPSHRAVVFVDPVQSIAERHVDAIESAFPWTTVTRVETVSALFESYCDIVALIVVHPSLLGEVAKMAREIGDRHPLALITVLDGGKDALPCSILSSRFIRGVLPLGGKSAKWQAQQHHKDKTLQAKAHDPLACSNSHGYSDGLTTRGNF